MFIENVSAVKALVKGKWNRDRLAVALRREGFKVTVRDIENWSVSIVGEQPIEKLKQSAERLCISLVSVRRVILQGYYEAAPRSPRPFHRPCQIVW